MSLMWSPPYQPANSQPPPAPPLQLSLHPPPHTLFSEDKLPNTHTKYPHTLKTQAHTNLCTQALAVLTHTHTILSAHSQAAWLGSQQGGEISTHPNTQNPQTPSTRHPFPHQKSAPAPTLSGNRERGAQDGGRPRSKASSWGSSLLKQGAPSGYELAALLR